jgi:hypothetical protein
MADRRLKSRQQMGFYYHLLMKNRGNVFKNATSKRLSSFLRLDKLMKTRRMEQFLAILISLDPPVSRDVWMHPRCTAWFEMVDEHFNDDQWYTNFRVTKGTFTYILNKIADDITYKDTTMRKAISAKCRLALTMYYLASTAEYRTIANLFGVSTAFVCICIREVCKAIQGRLGRVIEFPCGDKLQNVIDGFEEKSGFPMCIGAIDGTHIPILAPSDNGITYVNRKGVHTIVTQTVVDSNCLFTDIVVGWPGSVHDARVFSNSTIYEKAKTGKIFSGIDCKEIGGQQVGPLFIGDPAYPLLPWLMRPYKDNSSITRSERHFNYRISHTRIIVEHTFGRWKGRFRMFAKRVDMKVAYVTTVIAASCILHNICEMQNNPFLPNWEQDQQPDDTDKSATLEVQDGDAIHVRDSLAMYFTTQT